MDDKAAKVIQFPGKPKDASPAAVPTEAPAPALPTLPKGRANAWLGVLAVVLATVAVNRFVYRGVIRAHGAREIASVGGEFERDAAWEKNLAEKLAQPGSVGAVANVGHAPTLTERMRFADLDNRYVVTLTQAGDVIESIRANSEPVAIDGPKFLTKYGKLFDTAFAAAELESTGPAGEVFHLRSADGRELGRVHFFFDADHRLVKVETTRI